MRLLLIMLLLLPTLAEASVVVSEVAWMGSADSPNDEWLELYNTGDSGADLSGWTLSDGGTLSIALSGTLPAGRYAVLERTDDGSAPGAAFLIYTGALANTGATLTLRNAAGVVVDSVVGGAEWQLIGGSNETKETAQRRSSGWYTAAATPGSGAFSGTAAPTPEAAADDTPATPASTAAPTPARDKPTVRGGGESAVVLHRTPRPLFNTIEGASETLLRQPTTFTVATGGLGDTLLRSLTHTWNFGDGTTGVGEKVTHHYAYPGRYLVQVESRFKEYTAVARHEVVVRAVPLTLTHEDGLITITNDADYEVDLSGFSLTAKDTYTIPSRTHLLPAGSLRLPAERLNATPRDLVALYDASGALMASTRPVAPLATPPAVAPVPAAAVPTPTPRISTAAAELSLPPRTLQTTSLAALAVPVATTTLARATATQPLMAAASAAAHPSANLSYLGLLLVMALAVAGVLTRSRV